MSAEKDFAVQLLQLQADLAFEYGINFAERSVQLVGDIDEKMFCQLDAKLSLLEAQSRSKITIKISSEGGSVYDALAIVGRMQRSTCKIVTEGYGCIMSAASIILAAGNQRKMHSLAFFMHHEGGYEVGGTHTQVKHYVKQAERENKMWCETMAKLTAADADYWETEGLRGEDLYLDAQECLELKIIDEVF